MKHKMYVFATALLAISQLVSARVEAEYSGDYYQESSGSTVWGTETGATTAPLAVAAPLAPAALPAAKSEQLSYAPAQGESVAALTASSPVEEKKTMKITPMIGSGDYLGRWNINTKNNINLGLATEFQTSPFFSLEVEGGYANYSLAYTSLADPMSGYLAPRMMAHTFDQFSLGGNAKFYILQGSFRPYVGGGMAAVYYSGMQRRLPGDFVQSFGSLVGSGQAIAGADVGISRSTAIGVRGSVTIPVLNKPLTRDVGNFAAPGFEEAALIGTGYYKILGTVTVDM